MSKLQALKKALTGCIIGDNYGILYERPKTGEIMYACMQDAACFGAFPLLPSSNNILDCYINSYSTERLRYIQSAWGCKDLQELYFYRPWLLNESPWADAFPNKKQLYEENTPVQYNVNMPIEYILQAATLYRYLYVNYGGLEFVKNAVPHTDLDFTTLFLLASFFQHYEDGYFWINKVYYSGNMVDGFDCNTWNNIINNTRENFQSSLSSGRTNYGKWMGPWSESRKVSRWEQPERKHSPVHLYGSVIHAPFFEYENTDDDLKQMLRDHGVKWRTR